ADMRMLLLREIARQLDRRIGGQRCPGERQKFRTFVQEPFRSRFGQKELEPCLSPVAAVAVADKDAQDGGDNLIELVGRNDKPAVRSERLVAGGAAQRNSKIDPGFDAIAVLADPDGGG